METKMDANSEPFSFLNMPTAKKKVGVATVWLAIQRK